MVEKEKELWIKDHGDKLVDVNTLEKGLPFDKNKDQKDPFLRKLVTETVRIRKEFVAVEKKISSNKARKCTRVLSAVIKSTIVRKYYNSLPDTSKIELVAHPVGSFALKCQITFFLVRLPCILYLHLCPVYFSPPSRRLFSLSSDPPHSMFVFLCFKLHIVQGVFKKPLHCLSLII